MILIFQCKKIKTNLSYMDICGFPVFNDSDGSLGRDCCIKEIEDESISSSVSFITVRCPVFAEDVFFDFIVSIYDPQKNIV